MADVTATALVYPSGNDVVGSATAGDGKDLREENHVEILHDADNPALRNYVISGLDLSAASLGSPSSLVLNVASGKAILRGQHVTVDAASFTLTDNDTNHIYLKLDLDVNDRVASVSFEHNVTGTQPVHSVKLGEVVTASGGITSLIFNAPPSPLPGTHDVRNQWEFYEDFFALVGVSGGAGGTVQTFSHAWTVFGGSTAGAASVIGGVLSVQGDTANQGVATLGDSSALVFDVTILTRMAFRVAQFGAGAGTRRIGVAEAKLQVDSDGIYVRHTAAGNYTLVCRDAATETTLDTGIAAADGVFHDIDIQILDDGATVAIAVDGLSKGTITTNIPTTPLLFSAGDSTGNTGVGLLVDWVRLTGKR